MALAALPDSARIKGSHQILTMTTEPKPKAIKKKKRLRTPREEFVAYVVVIDE
jgi:hypothetical protein